eukprot:COSAG01_NODE_1077_length_11839_cov_52.054093_16_plen_81_part_00
MPSVHWRPAYAASAAAVMLELSTVAKRGETAARPPTWPTSACKDRPALVVGEGGGDLGPAALAQCAQGPSVGRLLRRSAA